MLSARSLLKTLTIIISCCITFGTSVTLLNGAYTDFSMDSTKNSVLFFFQHPLNPALTSKAYNTFTVLLDQDLPDDSVMLLQISRGSTLQVEVSSQISSDNIFNFEFLEVGGGLTISLSWKSPPLTSTISGKVVYNAQPLVVKRPTFIDKGNFIYTKQFFRGTYSQLTLYKAYQINVLEAGYLVLKRYDCIGHVEFDLTKEVLIDTKGKALRYQNLIRLMPETSNSRYDASERIYQVEPGIYYIMMLPGYGLALSVEDASKAYYNLESQFLKTMPSEVVIPSLVLDNLKSLKMEVNQEDSPLKVTWDPLEKGLPSILDLDVTYRVVVGKNLIVRDYYSHCGVDAPSFISGTRSPGLDTELEWEVKQAGDIENGQSFSYVIKHFSLEETDVAAGVEVEVKLGTSEGSVSSGRIFYEGVMQKKKPSDSLDIGIVFAIGGVLIVLAIPIFKGVQKIIRKRRRDRKASQYEISLPTIKEKSGGLSKRG